MKKIKIKLLGEQYEINEKSLQDDWEKSGKGKRVVIGCVDAASIIKQYVKRKYPHIVMWVASSRYSGGSSVSCNIARKDGEVVSEAEYQEISNFAENFRSGTFNGMIDSFEHRTDNPLTDNGTPISFYTSYLFVNNFAPWDYEYDSTKGKFIKTK